MKIVIGSDHAGFALKNKVMAHLKEKGYEPYDVGTYSSESCHYPVYAGKVAEAVASGEYDRGILVCGTGVGMSIAANKYKDIRAACCSDTFSARMTRMHNDANVICFGERVVGEGLAFDIVDVFLSTEFEGGKHATRVKMITDKDNSR